MPVDAKGMKNSFARTPSSDSYQGKVLGTAYSYNNLNAKKVVLHDNASDYAKAVLWMNSSVNKGKIVTEATCFRDVDQSVSLGLNLNDLDYDAIVMPGYYIEIGIITKQARDLINQSFDLI